MNKIMTKNKRGSVGINIPIPPSSRFSRFNEMGVQKTINQKTFSNESTAVRPRIITAGIRLNQNCSK